MTESKLAWSGRGGLLERHFYADGTSIVLVELRENRFATGFVRDPKDEEWVIGHYFSDFGDATADFNARMLRRY